MTSESFADSFEACTDCPMSKVKNDQAYRYLLNKVVALSVNESFDTLLNVGLNEAGAVSSRVSFINGECLSSATLCAIRRNHKLCDNA